VALLSHTQELLRAIRRPPFANGYEGESWMSMWCEDCIHFDDCPLLTVAVFGMTPATWQDRDAGAMNRYICPEHEAINGEETQVQGQAAP
jgi:hypothetical protein